MLRKQLVSLLVVGLLLVGFATHGLAKTTIVHWQHHSPARVQIVERLAAKFMEEHSDVEIRIESIPLADYFKKLLPALAAGSGPDTYQIPSGEVPAYKAAGVVGPLDEEVISASEIEEEFIPQSLAHLKHDGKYYGLPTDVQSIVLFYNPKLFEAAGLDPNRPPRTWAELIEYAQKLTKRDASGAMTQMGLATGGYGPVIYSLMIQNGATLWNEDTGLPDMDTKEAREALQFAVDMVMKYKVEDLQFGSRWTAFRQEQLGMVYAAPAMIGSFRATVPDLVFRVAEIPAPTEGGSQASILGKWAYVRSGLLKSDKVKIATEWIEMLTSAESQKLWTLETGELPSRIEVINDPDFQNDELLAPVMSSMRNGVPAPWTSRALDDEIMRKGYQLMVLKGASVEEAMTFVQKEAVAAEQEQMEKCQY